jgi:hypothetical protein
MPIMAIDGHTETLTIIIILLVIVSAAAICINDMASSLTSSTIKQSTWIKYSVGNYTC